MSLLELQRTIRDGILADDETVGEIATGLAVYRNNYRAQLLGALQARHELTRRWAGEEAFDAAARHHILSNPPSSWSLDDYGNGFDATLDSLFAQDFEVAELAWLEWHLQHAFGAPDGPLLDAAGLAAAAADGSDWQNAVFEPVASFAIRKIRTVCAPLWLALRDGLEPPEQLVLAGMAGLIVWREGLVPTFRVVDEREHAALVAVAEGLDFSVVCARQARPEEPEAEAETIGAMLGGWLRDGLLARVTFASAATD